MANKPVLLRKVKGGRVYQGGIFMLENVRLSYAHLDKPYAGTSDDGTPQQPSFSVTAIMDKKQFVEIKDELIKAFQQIKKDNKDAKVAKDKLCLRDGDDADKPEYEGAYTLSAREKRRPKVRDTNGELLEDPMDIANEVYSGCYANVLIRLWFQDNKFGKRINANLVAVRKTADGEAFGEAAIDDEDLYDDDEAGGAFSDDEDDI
jgi:hypothetical protein